MAGVGEDVKTEKSRLLHDDRGNQGIPSYLQIVPPLAGTGKGGEKSEATAVGVPPLRPQRPVIVCEREKRPCRKRFWGIILALCASICLSLTTLLAKLLIGYHPFNVAIWRFEGVLIPSVPVLIFATCVHQEPVFDSIKPVCEREKFRTFVLLFLRAIFGCSAVIMQFYSLQYIEIGDATVISFTTPVFVGLLSHVLLGERFGFVPVFSALLAILGIGIITRPPILSGAEGFDTNNLIGAGMALGCMFFATFTYVILRSLRHVHYGLVTFFYGFYSVLECVICALAIGVLELPQTGMDWFLALCLSLLAFAGQSFFTQALKYEEAGPVSLIRTSEVIFTFLWQLIFLSVIPDAFSFFGALAIITGVIITTLRKWVNDLDVDSPTRQRLWVLLK